ncbi:MAG: FAD-binding protein [Ilumatobacteraceae bacterium]
MGVSLDESVAAFADDVGAAGPATITGLGTRGGPVADCRTVRAPAGIDWIQAAEMTVRCGAGTPVAELDRALAEYGQCVAIPDFGTVGGALAVGRSDLRRLAWGPVRDTVLQVKYVSSRGEVVKAGGPTVKNVSGFDLCRLLVGSYGTLGFLAEVILRTRPRPVHEQWFTSRRDPWGLLGELYRPTSVLWDGSTSWVLLDGHPDDVGEQAADADLVAVDAAPDLPPHRWSVPPAELTTLRDEPPGTFVAEIGVGIVHHSRPAPKVLPDAETIELHRRIRMEFDPTGRLNPGLDVLTGP